MNEKSLQPKAKAPLDLETLAQLAVPFGPAFFLTNLGAFVRDRCPTPTEALPVVHLHLASGEVLELCHVIGLAARWAAMAVVDTSASDGSRPMRTELVPYELVVRITIRAGQARGTHIGFHQGSPPVLHTTPEELLQIAGTLRTHLSTDSPQAAQG